MDARLVRLVRGAAVVLLVVAMGVLATRVLVGRADSVAAGVEDDRLAGCPSPANCVSTSGSGEALVEPIVCTDPDPAERVVEVVTGRGWNVVEDRTVGDTRYLHVVASTRVFRFLDDVEVLVLPNDDWVRIRSASRVGAADLGTNRARVESLRQDLAASCGTDS